MQACADLVGIIPARMASTRLPGKPLLKIAGVPMIERVYAGAAQCKKMRAVVVATDSPEIEQFCRERRIPVHMTSAAHVSGTDRVWEVAEAMDAAAVVNIQGDEPMVRADMLDALIAALFSDASVQVASLYTPVAAEEAQLPSACKVAMDERERALYFSRAPIPFPRNGAPRYYKHLGFYAYSRSALRSFHAWAPTALEQAEGLEQLRFLFHGVGIQMAQTRWNTIGIDTREDVAAAEQALAAAGEGG
ncbi:MAG: 3-deoxy-manno-octulosonate cytidylyltransferase [Terriglobales bacterium]